MNKASLFELRSKERRASRVARSALITITLRKRSGKFAIWSGKSQEFDF